MHPRTGVCMRIWRVALGKGWTASVRTGVLWARHVQTHRTRCPVGSRARTGNNGIIINAAADTARNVNTGDWNVYTNGTTAPAAEIVLGVTVTFTAASANNFVDLFGRASAALLNSYSMRIAGAGANNVT